MSSTNVTRSYQRSEFINAGIGGINFNKEVFEHELSLLGLGVVPAVNPLQNNVVQLVWTILPVDLEADFALIDAAVAAHQGGATVDEPAQFEALGNIDASSSTPVTIFDQTSPPLAEGTYLVLGATTLLMPSIVANTACQASFSIGPGVGVLISQTTVASATQPFAFSPHAMLKREAGQTIRMLMQVAKIGASAATARATNSRLSYCRVA